MTPPATARKPEETPADAIERQLRVLIPDGAVVELRALDVPQQWGAPKTASGYYDDLTAMARDAATLTETAPVVYFTLQDIVPDLLDRSPNKCRPIRKEPTTSDDNVVRYRWLPLDLDPVRPSGLSSTDAEHDLALERAEVVRAGLVERGFPENSIVVGDSGNGAYCLVRVDLPVDDKQLVQRAIEGANFLWSDDAVGIDSTCANPARIWKVPGTKAAGKGADTQRRPHRVARILSAPETFSIAPREVIERLANVVPKPVDRPRHRATSDFDLDAWIGDHGVPVKREGKWSLGRRWILDPCPWNSEHAGGSAYIVQFEHGAIAAGCHHNSCAGRGWPDLRELYEPGYRDRKAALKPTPSRPEPDPDAWAEYDDADLPEEPPWVAEPPPVGSVHDADHRPMVALPRAVNIKTTQAEPVEWDAGTFLRRKGLTMCWAAPGVGKTYLWLRTIAEMSRHSDAGANVLWEHPDIPILRRWDRCLWIASEETAGELNFKMQMVMRGLLNNPRATAADFPGELLHIHAANVERKVTLYDLGAIYDQEGPFDIVVLDSLTALRPKEGKFAGVKWDASNDANNDLLLYARGIASDRKTHIAVIHHSDKGEKQYRGPIELKASVDVMFGMTGDEDESRFTQLVINKNRDGHRLRDFDLGRRWDNQEGFFCWYEHRSRVAKLSPTAQAVKTFMEGREPTAQSDIVRGVPGSRSTIQEAVAELTRAGILRDTGIKTNQSPVFAWVPEGAGSATGTWNGEK